MSFHRAALVVTLGLVTLGCSSKSKPSGADSSASPRERPSILKKASRRVVGDLSYPIAIDVHATAGWKDVDAFLPRLRELLDAYVEASRRDAGRGEPWVTVTYVDPKTPEQIRAARSAGLTEQAADDSPAKGFMGIVFKVGAQQDNIPFWPPRETTGLEFFLTSKLREMRLVAEDRKIAIGIITGKKELALTDETIAPSASGQAYHLQGVFEQYLPVFEFVKVDLEGGAQPVDPRLDGLLVTQPQVDYTEAELRRIDAFLMLGGKGLTVMASAVNLPPFEPAMRATLSTHGLERLLDGYGVAMAMDAVFDPGDSFTLKLEEASETPRSVPIPWALVAAADSKDASASFLDTSFPPFFRLDRVTLPFASSLVLHPEKQPGATMKARARTSASAVSVSDPSIDMSLVKVLGGAPSGSGPAGEKIVAASLEGTIASAFEDGRTSRDSRVLVVASSQFLANPFARAGNPPPMPPQMRMMGGASGDRDLQMVARFYYKDSFPWLVMSFKNTLDWMAGDEDFAELSATLSGPKALSSSSSSPWTNLLK